NVIIFCQLGMICGVVPVAMYFNHLSIGLLGTLLVMHAVFAATQDVAIDGWAMASVSEDERGRLNAAMQAGMLTARWVFGAGLLLIPALSLDTALWSIGGLVCAAPLIMLTLANEKAPAREERHAV